MFQHLFFELLSSLILCISVPILYFVISPRIIKYLFIIQMNNPFKLNLDKLKESSLDLSRNQSESKMEFNSSIKSLDKDWDFELIQKNSISYSPYRSNIYANTSSRKNLDSFDYYDKIDTTQKNSSSNSLIYSSSKDILLSDSVEIPISGSLKISKVNELATLNIWNYSRISTFSKHMFSIGFTISALCFLFLILDLLLGGDKSIRIQIWRTLKYLIIIYTLFSPITLIWNFLVKKQLTYRSNSSNVNNIGLFGMNIDLGYNSGLVSRISTFTRRFIHVISTVILYSICIYIFIRISNHLYLGNEDPLNQSQYSSSNQYIIVNNIEKLISNIFDRITFIGFVLVGILSGYGSIQIPMEYLFSQLIYKHHDIDDEHYENNLIQLEKLNKTIQEKTAQLNSFIKQEEDHKKKQTNSISSLIASINPFTSKSGLIKEKYDEIISLENLKENLILELQYITQHIRLKNQGKFRRRLLYFIGFIFSFWCLYRLFMSSFNIILDRRKILDRDPFVSRLLQYATEKTEINFLAFHQQLNLITLFIVVLLSIRSLLLNIRILFKKIFSLSTNLIVQTLTILIPIYTLSSIILFMVYLPISNRNILSSVFSLALEHEKYFFIVFDWIFVISALLSFAIDTVSRLMVYSSFF